MKCYGCNEPLLRADENYCPTCYYSVEQDAYNRGRAVGRAEGRQEAFKEAANRARTRQGQAGFLSISTPKTCRSGRTEQLQEQSRQRVAFFLKMPSTSRGRPAPVPPEDAS